jgi:hypothetical protein
MAYTNPKTWASGVLLSTDMNTYIRDNQTALKDPPFDHYESDEVSNYSTASTTFVDVDATDFSLSITTTGGDIFVGFTGMLVGVTSNKVFFELELDGVAVGGDDGITGMQSASTIAMPINFGYWIIAPSAASHTVKLQWRVTGSTTTIYAGAGTANGDVHPQFYIREVS